MRVIRGLHNLRPEHRGCVATIGNFDGVHLGHQAVFAHLREQARAMDLPTTVITFEPQPLEYFAPDRAPARLTRLREKLRALREAEIDQVVLLEFGPRLAAMEAQRFIQELLVDGLNVAYLFVGDDFRFGQGRAGDIAMLRWAGVENGFAVEDMNTYMLDAERVSSTRIREALARACEDGAIRALILTGSCGGVNLDAFGEGSGSGSGAGLTDVAEAAANCPDLGSVSAVSQAVRAALDELGDLSTEQEYLSVASRW